MSWVTRTGSMSASLVAVACAFLATPAPPLAAHDGDHDRAQRDGRSGEEQIARETRTLAIGENGSLELRTFSGDITVTGGGGREARLEVIWHLRGTAEDLQRARERVSVVIDHQGSRASVATVSRGDRRMTPRVNVSYIVAAPSGTSVSASTMSGDLAARNLRGDLSAAVTSGSIEIRDAAQVSTARTVSGDIALFNVASAAGMSVGTISGDVQIDGGRAARTEVETVSGEITARNVTSNNVSLRSLSGTVDFLGAVARGGRYEFQSHSGDILLALGGPSGFQLQATTVSGDIRAATDLSLQSISSNRRALRATAGDGRAVIVATTFSGDVAIRKR